MTRARRLLLHSVAHGLWLGSIASAVFAGMMAYEAYGPWVVGGLCLIVTGSMFMLLAVTFNDDDASRFIELRAAVAYALHLHQIHDGGSLLFLKMHRAGHISLKESFPSWPQFRADFIRQTGDA